MFKYNQRLKKYVRVSRPLNNRIDGRNKRTDLKDTTPEPLPTGQELYQEFLERRASGHGSPMTRIFPIYQIGCQHMIPEDDRELMWSALDAVIATLEKRFFKRFQYKHYRIQRILAFIELGQAYWYKIPGWVFTTYSCAFPDIEAVLQMRRWGIGTGEESIMMFRCWEAKHLAAYMGMKRAGYKDYGSYMYEVKGKVIKQSTIDLFHQRTVHLEQILRVTTARSLDTLIREASNEQNIDDLKLCNMYEDWIT